MAPETSARNHHYSLRNSPEERSYHLLRGGSMKSHMALFASFVSWLRVTTKLETSRGAKNSQRVVWNVQLGRALNSFTQFQITGTYGHYCKWHQTYTTIFLLWHGHGKWIAVTTTGGILRLPEDGLQTYRVAVNILNKQPCTANKG